MKLLPSTISPWDRWPQTAGSWWGRRRWGRPGGRSWPDRWSWAPADWWPPVDEESEPHGYLNISMFLKTSQHHCLEHPLTWVAASHCNTPWDLIFKCAAVLLTDAIIVSFLCLYKVLMKKEGYFFFHPQWRPSVQQGHWRLWTVNQNTQINDISVLHISLPMETVATNPTSFP